MSRVTVAACTRRGAEIAARITHRLHGARGYSPQGAGGLEPLSGGLAANLQALWEESGALVLVGAVGVAVRLVAPRLLGKALDPAVVAVDDAGRFAVPIASGHLGGANALAEEIAEAIGAIPVVTTAADAFGLPQADLLGRGLGWSAHGEAGLRAVASALVEGETVGVWHDAGQPLSQADGWREDGTVRLVRFDGPDELQKAVAAGEASAGIAVSDRLLPGDALDWSRGRVAVYRPRTLVAGVGCARGAGTQEVLDLLAMGLGQAGLAPESVGALASIDLKRTEQGLLEAASRLGLNILWFSAEELSGAQGVEHPSDAVRAAVGTPSVAEAAALLGAGPGASLALPKRKGRAATVAIARQAAGLPLEIAHPRAGRGEGNLAVVGIGPGDETQLTLAARQALRSADVIVGYRLYLELLRPWLGPKVYLASEITQEEDRAQSACRLAERGLRVALVSSGDAGIYGMATLAFSILERQGWDGEHPAVRVLPGVTAASAAGALLGAPLSSDFAAISLSDRLTPWPVIAQRLEAAAASGFAIALYNPTSRARAGNFARACAILRRARGDDAPVGIVRSAFRSDQQMRLSTLGRLPEEAVDMMTIVVLAGLGARRIGGRLVTPRGYPAQREISLQRGRGR